MILENDNTVAGLYLDEDIEASVRKIMSQLAGKDGNIFTKVKRRYKRVVIPKFRDDQERLVWGGVNTKC